MMSWLVAFLVCCFLLVHASADEFWWADQTKKDEKSKPKEIILTKKSNFVIKENISGKTLNKINVSGYLMNEIKVENSNLQILVLAVHSQTKDKPNHAMSDPISSECIIRREEVLKNPHPNIIPECDENGDYSEVQCLHDAREMCQCWNKNGHPVSTDFTIIVDCSCFLKRAIALENSKHLIGVFVPQCNMDGTYKSKQCSASSGMCWCVNSKGESISEPTRSEITCHETNPFF